jgi:hypothetical protein
MEKLQLPSLLSLKRMLSVGLQVDQSFQALKEAMCTTPVLALAQLHQDFCPGM